MYETKINKLHNYLKKKSMSEKIANDEMKKSLYSS